MPLSSQYKDKDKDKSPTPLTQHTSADSELGATAACLLPKSSGDKPKRKLKPKFKLNLPSLVIPQAAPAPSKEIKKEDVANLLRETNAQPKSSFKHADFHDGYQELSQDGYDNQFAGYKISNPVIGDVFIHAIKVDDSRKFSGDKFHISIEQSQLSKGFDSILPLLLSEDSPIDKWKVTDLKSCPSDARVAVGAQVTLYVKADKELGYGSKELKKIKDFVGEIELTLGKMIFHLGLNLNQMFLQRLGILSLIEMNTEVIGMVRLLTYLPKNLFTKSFQTNGIRG